MNVDFDLHGVVRIRLVDPPAAAVAAVTTDTGLRPAPASGTNAALTVVFTDALDLAEPIRRVGRTAGFSGTTFLLGAAEGSRTALDLADNGAVAELRCERDVVHVPHLVSLINRAMLAQGVLPLHAGAVVHDGRGLVATGWSKGGKTELVLGLMAAGAPFVADEWCYLRPGERQVLGLRHPVRVWDWQLRQLPSVSATLTPRQRLRLAATRRLAGTGRLGRAVDPTLGVSSPPERLFGESRLADSCRLDTLVLVEARDAPTIVTQRIDPAEVAERMQASLQAERAELDADLLRLRFAFPGRGALDAVAAREGELLRQAFAGVPTWLVAHPYPVDLVALAGAVARLG